MNTIKISDFEIFKYDENKYTEFENNGKKYLLNVHPYLDVVLTDHCNSDCNFCIADLIHNKLNASFEIFKEKVLFAINNMNVKDVLILGGEPTVSKILLPMIKWLRMQNLDRVIMTTNAIALRNKDYRKEIFNSGLTNVNISFMNINVDKQKEITSQKIPLTVEDLHEIYEDARLAGVKIRINNNIFYKNNDTLNDIIEFYDSVKTCCDSVKFSPLFPVDNFSVINIKTDWVNKNILPNDAVEFLFNETERYFSRKYNTAIIENDLQFGFVKNTMIPMNPPIIMNWNFGKYTNMMKKVIEEKKINNLKLLPNNELSLSWNRELDEYFISTNKFEKLLDICPKNTYITV